MPGTLQRHAAGRLRLVVPLASITVETHTGALGTYLTDQSGRTLYLWVADTGGASKCSGSCATAWPPLTVPAGAKPAAAGSASASALGTTARADGSWQVTYDGHPLYYFVGDKTAGTTAGQGSDGFGAKWWVVAPDGSAVTKLVSGAAATAAAKPLPPAQATPSTSTPKPSATATTPSAGGGWS